MQPVYAVIARRRQEAVWMHMPVYDMMKVVEWDMPTTNYECGGDYINEFYRREVHPLNSPDGYAPQVFFFLREPANPFNMGLQSIVDTLDDIENTVDSILGHIEVRDGGPVASACDLAEYYPTATPASSGDEPDYSRGEAWQ